LADTSDSDFKNLIEPHLTIEDSPQGVVIAEVGDEVDRIAFPLSGMISLVIVMKDGKAIETATIGRNGFFGASAGLGLYKTGVRAIVQVAMTAAWMPATQFRKAVIASKAINDICIDYNETLLVQARVTASCNALHRVEARLCRWLLQTRAVTGSDTIPLTQEFLSEMLGVRRTSVTEVASKLQATGAISYSRGTIRIRDAAALAEHCCECLETLIEHRAL
jgi:CRP-like cAMP-binding protein